MSDATACVNDRQVLECAGVLSSLPAKIAYAQFKEPMRLNTREIVAQIANLLFRRFPTCRVADVPKHSLLRCALRRFATSADRKSAKRQVGNLRYNACRPRQEFRNVGTHSASICAAIRFALAFLLIIPCLVQTTNSAALDLPLREFKGRIVCIPEEMNRLHKTELPTRHEHIYGFRSDDGSVYTLLRTRLSEALFVDERVRGKDLLLRARLLPKTQILDVSTIRSVKDGVVQDLYYYCVICDIESVSPEECACCQGPVELKEVPLRNVKS